MALLDDLKTMLLKAQNALQAYQTIQVGDNAEKLYQVTLESLGTDASPDNLASSEYACADTVTSLINRVDPSIKWTNKVSTYYLRRDLKAKSKFKQINIPERGAIIISATGYGGKNGIKNGHCGIFLDSTNIASNNSFNGKLEQNYTLASWKNRYVTLGGYEVLYFRLL